jgi:AraC-like DNA-binding protein
MLSSGAAFLAPAGIQGKVQMTQRRVKTAHGALGLKETKFENDRLARLGVEVMSFSYLFKRTTVRALSRPERVHFYMLMLITQGRGRHTVDCVTAPLSPGSLVLVRPGQMQQWHPDRRYAAQIVMFDPNALEPATLAMAGVARLEGCPSVLRLPRASAAAVLADIDAMKGEIRRYAGDPVDAGLIQSLLMVLLSRVTRCGARDAGGAAPLPIPGAHRLFLRMLESRFRREHRVYGYARLLGYSTSTLNRACSIAEGRSAKSIIDRRIALEAQRLLIHSRATLVEISHHLGFSEPTNFVKFFARVTGRKPESFRC